MKKIVVLGLAIAALFTIIPPAASAPVAAAEYQEIQLSDRSNFIGWWTVNPNHSVNVFISATASSPFGAIMPGSFIGAFGPEQGGRIQAIIQVGVPGNMFEDIFWVCTSIFRDGSVDPFPGHGF